MKRTIGWIGTGVMGRSMALHLIDAGFEVLVTTRTRERADDVVAAGGRWVESPAQLVTECDVVVSIVGYPEDVERVYLGDDGMLAAATEDGPLKLIIDMTTSAPDLAQRIAGAALGKGILSLDAPVSGGDVGARNGTLSVMVGGDDAAFAAAEDIFAPLAKSVVHLGGPGAGQHTKMVNQIFIASTMVGVCEGILYAETAGLDPATVLAAVAGGAAGSWTVDNLAPRILKGDFAPGFFVEHFIKDMSIAVEEAERLGLQLPGLTQAKKLYEKLRDLGHGRSGTQALILALRTE